VFSFRKAELPDAGAVGEAVIRGFDGYRSFAPAGWEPPAVVGEVERIRGLMASGDLWCEVAERDGAWAGVVAFTPASASFAPVDDPRLGHLRYLFIEPEWWGSGLAVELHGHVVEEAIRRGYTALRLFTPAEQARARRFYEREGWRQDGDAPAAGGLPTVQYRRALS
jgi:GNAT superfamily N-acetyltransferase